MSQIVKKFLGNDQVDGTKIDLLNNAGVRSKNFAGTADVVLIKLDASDVITFATLPQAGSSLLATQAYAQAQVSASAVASNKEVFTLLLTDITNQYLDLAQVAKLNSVRFTVSGLTQSEGFDYSVSLTGGTGGKSRILLSAGGDIATGGPSALVAGDKVYIQYLY